MRTPRERELEEQLLKLQGAYTTLEYRYLQLCNKIKEEANNARNRLMTGKWN